MGYGGLKHVSDASHSELTPNQIYEVFRTRYFLYQDHFSIREAHFEQIRGIRGTVTVETAQGTDVAVASGNGRLDAVSNAIRQYFNLDYKLQVYEEHAPVPGLRFPGGRPTSASRTVRGRCTGASVLTGIL